MTVADGRWHKRSPNARDDAADARLAGYAASKARIGPEGQAGDRLRRMQFYAAGIQQNWASFAEDYAAGLTAGDWEQLGYASLADWRDAALGDGRKWVPAARRAIVAALTEVTAMTTRELAEATGSSSATVSRDQREAGASSEAQSPRQQAAREREQQRRQAEAERERRERTHTTPNGTSLSGQSGQGDPSLDPTGGGPLPAANGYRKTVSSSSAEWATPAEVFDKLAAEFGPFDLDVAASPANTKVAANFYTAEVDGLSQPWNCRAAWCNPPYGRTDDYGRNIGAWLAKAAAETASGRAGRVVCLVPASVGSRWYREAEKPAALVRIWAGRIRFNGGDPAPFDSAVFVYGTLPAVTAEDASPRPHNAPETAAEAVQGDQDAGSPPDAAEAPPFAHGELTALAARFRRWPDDWKALVTLMGSK